MNTKIKLSQSNDRTFPRNSKQKPDSASTLATRTARRGDPLPIKDVSERSPKQENL